MEFIKMHGTGNDFIFIEDLHLNLLDKEIELAKKVCHRRFGIGADGLVLIRKSNKADIKMEIINSDGSRANMCGNAIRCFSKYVYENNIVNKILMDVETGDGIKEIELFVNGDNKVLDVRVCMGVASFDGCDIPLLNKESLINEYITVEGEKYLATSLLLGVPHTVIIDSEEKFSVEEGRKLEKHNFFKFGTNVNFVKVVDSENIYVRTWERGAGATYSCGTGCSASVVVCKMLELTEGKVRVFVKGGELTIELINDKIYMSGGAEIICKGVVF